MKNMRQLLVLIACCGACLVSAADLPKIFPSSLNDPVKDQWRLPATAQWLMQDGQVVLQYSTTQSSLSPENPILELQADLLHGKSFRLVGEIAMDNVSKPQPFKTFFGVKLMCAYTSGGVNYYQEPKVIDQCRFGTRSWFDLEKYFAAFPDDVKAISLSFGLQGSTGTVRLRNLRLEEDKRYEPKLPENFRCEYTDSVKNLPRLRGAMSPEVWRIKEQDIRDLAKLGANAIRWQFVYPAHLSKGKGPNGYQEYFEDRMNHLASLMPVFRETGIKVIIDCHTPPGGRGGNVVLGTAGKEATKSNTADRTAFKMFFDKDYLDQYLANWKTVATRFKDEPAVVAYDLVNEPDQQTLVNYDYLWIQEQAAHAIRRIDPERPIIVTCNEWANPSSFKYLLPINEKNIFYTFHMYEPGDYTHQGIQNNYEAQKKGQYVTYPKPGIDKTWLRNVMLPVRDFQLKYGARIYVGEFGVIRFAPGAAQYLDDLISIFEEYNWDWTFHAFREWYNWSAEHTSVLEENKVSPTPTDRLQILLKYYKKNQIGKDSVR